VHEASVESHQPRVAIEGISPELDAGRFPIKRVVGDLVCVSASIFADGHDRIAAVLRHRPAPDGPWTEVSMRAGPNDRWEGEFRLERLGLYEYAIEAWIDVFGSWREALSKKARAQQDVASELLEGATLVTEAARRTRGAEAARLEEWAVLLASAERPERRVEAALAPELFDAISRYPDRSRARRSDRVLAIQVERERARSGAWYEFFPRSCADEPGRHGTFRDAERRLEHAAALGFDVIYLPPIHPIGVTNRKGPNNARAAGPDDPGSPWAIGADEGGHKAVHPALGTLADFDRLVGKARDLGLEVALDLAFQCSPDHPYVRKHPEWFHQRPDGSIHYAENPPKRYEDIYPLNFACEGWEELWAELESVVLFWIDRGISIFRVDNPHTKPFPFWEWLLGRIRARYPEVVFLSEAFTRPSVLLRLGKLGFSQSYGYFTWRNTKSELVEYFTGLAREPARDCLRPNLFANTPDILSEFLQIGVRAAFQIRVTLAATLAGSYGIYGPAFEICEASAAPDSEEYWDSEKYQIRHWDLDRPGNIRDYIARLNEIRRENPALTRGGAPRFHDIDNDQLIAYSRHIEETGEFILVVVNLDPHHAQSGWIDLPLDAMGVAFDQPFQTQDLLGGARFLWHGPRNYVHLDPAELPAHVFRLRRKLRTEREFDYYL
jgi:starch synthase (maltosyl-transferring)